MMPAAAVRVEALPPPRLLDAYSLEITAKDRDGLAAVAHALPPATRVSITYLPGEKTVDRVAAAKEVRRLGLIPVPHLSARRVERAAELEAYLEALQAEAAVNEVFVVGGDLATSEGPFPDALSLIESGLLERYSVRRVGVAGYPEGHAAIPRAVLNESLLAKQAALHAREFDWSITTQFCFDAERVLAWLEEVRNLNIAAPVRVGVPGPTSVKALLRFAARCGVGASASMMKKYGISLTRLLGTAGPDPFLEELGQGLNLSRHGQVFIHFYPFGGVPKTVEWAQNYLASCAAGPR